MASDLLEDKVNKDVVVLSIESSCDETSAAVVKNGREVLSNIIATQIDIHKRRCSNGICNQCDSKCNTHLSVQPWSGRTDF